MGVERSLAPLPRSTSVAMALLEQHKDEKATKLPRFFSHDKGKNDRTRFSGFYDPQ